VDARCGLKQVLGGLEERFACAGGCWTFRACRGECAWLCCLVRIVVVAVKSVVSDSCFSGHSRAKMTGGVHSSQARANFPVTGGVCASQASRVCDRWCVLERQLPLIMRCMCGFVVAVVDSECRSNAVAG